MTWGQYLSAECSKFLLKEMHMAPMRLIPSSSMPNLRIWLSMTPQIFWRRSILGTVLSRARMEVCMTEMTCWSMISMSGWFWLQSSSYLLIRNSTMKTRVSLTLIFMMQFIIEISTFSLYSLFCPSKLLSICSKQLTSGVRRVSGSLRTRLLRWMPSLMFLKMVSTDVVMFGLFKFMKLNSFSMMALMKAWSRKISGQYSAMLDSPLRVLVITIGSAEFSSVSTWSNNSVIFLKAKGLSEDSHNVESRIAEACRWPMLVDAKIVETPLQMMLMVSWLPMLTKVLAVFTAEFLISGKSRSSWVSMSRQLMTSGRSWSCRGVRQLGQLIFWFMLVLPTPASHLLMYSLPMVSSTSRACTVVSFLLRMWSMVMLMMVLIYGFRQSYADLQNSSNASQLNWEQLSLLMYTISRLKISSLKIASPMIGFKKARLFLRALIDSSTISMFSFSREPAMMPPRNCLQVMASTSTPAKLNCSQMKPMVTMEALRMFISWQTVFSARVPAILSHSPRGISTRAICEMTLAPERMMTGCGQTSTESAISFTLALASWGMRSQKNGLSWSPVLMEIERPSRVAADWRVNQSQLLSTNTSAQPMRKLRVCWLRQSTISASQLALCTLSLFRRAPLISQVSLELSMQSGLQMFAGKVIKFNLTPGPSRHPKLIIQAKNHPWTQSWSRGRRIFIRLDGVADKRERGQLMISNKPRQKISTTRSNKKTTRRVQTETDEPIPYRRTELSNRGSERNYSKQKYLDVYSKINMKESYNPRKTFKVNTHKQPYIHKHMKTEPDEVSRKLTGQSAPSPQSRYQTDGVAGKGTFGTVYFGHIRGSGQKIAIKKVLQDKRYKNRQLQILKTLKNPNVLQMRDHFLTYEGDKEFLNVVMDYFPYNLFQVIKKKELDLILDKVYMYQILRGLNYITTLAIAHRDIKPQNILVDLVKNKAVVCDFGSAKQLVPGQPNLAYICSRCYRAPELIFGATDYTSQIDMWSTGCVLVEMINGDPPFIGDSQIDQLIEIIKVLGTPPKEDILQMNKNYDMKEYNKFPIVKAADWKSVLKCKDPLLIDLVSQMLKYSPVKRITAAQAMMHPFFDDLRDEAQYKQILLRCKTIPQLFDFSKEQLKTFEDPEKVIPKWVESKHSYGVNMSKMGSIQVKRPVHRFV